MYFDKEEKTVKIPIRIINGQVKYFYGCNLPRIAGGIIGELVLPEHSVLDNSFVRLSNWEEAIQILPSGSSIMVEINKTYEDNKDCFVTIVTKPLTANAFVLVELISPLKLMLRGTKKSKLLGVECKIPCLGRKADSLNSAYTIISEKFEPERVSHTGNVFRKCYYTRDGHEWFPLDTLRENVEANFEERLLLDDKVFVEKVPPNTELTDDEKLLLAYLKCSQQIKGAKIKELYNQDKLRYIRVLHSLLDKNVIDEKAGD